MVISRVIIRVTPFRALITLLITYLLSPLHLQVTLLGYSHTCLIQKVEVSVAQDVGQVSISRTINWGGLCK